MYATQINDQCNVLYKVIGQKVLPFATFYTARRKCRPPEQPWPPAHKGAEFVGNKL